MCLHSGRGTLSWNTADEFLSQDVHRLCYANTPREVDFAGLYIWRSQKFSWGGRWGSPTSAVLGCNVSFHGCSVQAHPVSLSHHKLASQTQFNTTIKLITLKIALWTFFHVLVPCHSPTTHINIQPLGHTQVSFPALP